MSVRYERTEWTSPTKPQLQRGRIDEIVASPNGGSTGVTRSKMYKYKLPQPDDSPHKKDSKRRVMEQAQTNAQDSFDEDKVEAKRTKRRAKAAAKAAEAARPQLAQAAAEAAPSASPLAIASAGDTNRNGQLSWALLRAFKRIGNAAGVLEVLRMTSLVPPPAEDDELWTPQCVAARHRALVDAVRMVAELVGEEHPLARMLELRALCE